MAGGFEPPNPPLRTPLSSGELFYVSELDVQCNNIEVSNLPVIPGTMNTGLHQIISFASETDKIFYSDVSCFCACDKVSC